MSSSPETTFNLAFILRKDMIDKKKGKNLLVHGFSKEDRNSYIPVFNPVNGLLIS